MKILMPVDGSGHTKRMLGCVAAHGEWLGKGHGLLVVKVVAAMSAYVAGFLDNATLDEHYAEQAPKRQAP